MPQEPPRPRQPSKPEGIVTPDQPERAAVRRHPGVDGVPQPAPARVGTLPGMPALKPPPLPFELAKTQRAPSTTSATVRATPPTGIRIPADETPSSGQAGAAMPPVSQSPEAAANAALRARAEAAEARRDELERRERVRAEAQSPAGWPPATVQRSQTPVPSSGGESIRPDGSITSLRKAQTRLYLALAAFVALAAYPTVSWLQAIVEAKAQSQRADTKANTASTAADSAKEKAGATSKELVELRNEFRLYRANMREVMRLQGIDMPRHPDDPDANDLKPVTPYCPHGKVCSGPTLVLQVAP